MTLKEIAGDPRRIETIMAFLRIIQENAKKKNIYVSDSVLDVIGQLSEEVARRNCEVCREN